MRVAPFRFDRTFALPVARCRVWSVLQQLDEYPEWWGWLRRFAVPTGAGLEPGVTAECEVRGPLPYSLHFAVTVEEAVEAERVVTAVTGDLEGPARLELADRDGGCAARLAWEVEIREPALRGAALVARPVMEWGHDHVVDRGLSQFRHHAL